MTPLPYANAAAYKIERKGEHWPWTVKHRGISGRWELLFSVSSLDELTKILVSNGVQ